MSFTTVGSGLAARWPRARLWSAVLVISLALNVFFVAAELALDAQQRAAFEHYAAAMRARNEKAAAVTGPLLGAAWDEIAKPNADTKRIQQLLDQAAEARRQSAEEAMQQTLEFMSLLSPEQRAKFVALARERRARMTRPNHQNY